METQPVGGQALRPRFWGSGGKLFQIYFRNLLLNIVTLGVYHYWGKTRVRRFLYEQTEFGGDRFAYHGTGLELFLGALKAMGFVAALVVCVTILMTLFPGEGQEIAINLNLLIYAALLFVIPYIIVAARRYRMSRTSWRGVRFSFRGDPWEFTKLFLRGALLTLVSLGFYTPIFQTTLRKFISNHTSFGNRRFEFNGDGMPLFWPYVKMLLLLLPTLGIFRFWYEAEKERYLWGRTGFCGAAFSCSVTGRELFALKLVNALIIVFTIGFGIPFVRVRNARFLMDHLRLTGSIDLDAIRQDAQAASAAGEGLADVLDTEMAEIDIGL